MPSWVEPVVRYHYWIELRDGAGHVTWNGPLSLTTAARPGVTLARAPFPNPVVRDAAFEYTIGSDAARGGLADVSLTIHDVSGRLVRTIKQAREGVGVHRAQWDATDQRGARVAGGVYFLRLRAGGGPQAPASPDARVPQGTGSLPRGANVLVKGETSGTDNVPRDRSGAGR